MPPVCAWLPRWVEGLSPGGSKPQPEPCPPSRQVALGPWQHHAVTPTPASTGPGCAPWPHFLLCPRPCLVPAPGLSFDVADTLVQWGWGRGLLTLAPQPRAAPWSCVCRVPRLLLWTAGPPVSARCPVVPGACSPHPSLPCPARPASDRRALLASHSWPGPSICGGRQASLPRAPSPAPARAWPRTPAVAGEARAPHASWPPNVRLVEGRSTKPDEIW